MLEASRFKDKIVLIRVDFNVPIADGEVRDNTRIKRALPTINSVLNNGGAVILMSHLGRPQKNLLEGGVIDKSVFSLGQIVEELGRLLQRRVKFSSDCGGEISKHMASQLQPGEVLLLENTRFYKEENGSIILVPNPISGPEEIERLWDLEFLEEIGKYDYWY